MKKIITISLFCLTSVAALSNVAAQAEPIRCISNAPAHTAEGTAIDLDEGQAASEAERRAIETAKGDCEGREAGMAVFLDVQTRTTGVVATTVARYVCSASC